MDAPGRIPRHNLEGMGVETTHGRVKHPDSLPDRDDAGDGRQIFSESSIRQPHSKFRQALAVRKPSFGRSFRPGRMPDLPGPKMGAIRIGIPHSLNQSHLSGVEQPPESFQRGMKSDGVVQLQDVPGRNGQIRTLPVVVIQAMRDHHVEAIAASGQLDEYQRPPRVIRPHRRCPGRFQIWRKKGRCQRGSGKQARLAEKLPALHPALQFFPVFATPCIPWRLSAQISILQHKHLAIRPKR